MTATLASRFKSFQQDIAPDCDALINKVLLRKGTPARVHHMELFHDGPIVDAICEMFGIKAALPESDPLHNQARIMAMHRFLGFDYMYASVGGIGLNYKWTAADDTADNAKNQRGWMDEHRGPIASWEDFEKYPWPDARNVNVDDVKRLAKLLPEGMCLAGRGGHWCENLVWLMGYETLCFALYDDRDLVLALREKIDELEVATAEALLSVPEVKFMWASDDLGFRTGLLISPNDTRELVLSGHQKIAKMWHDAGRPYILHACGNRTDITRDMIHTTRLDAIHSFEDTIEMVTDAKKNYGTELSVIGGLDVDFLCRCDEDAIRKRVRETLNVCQPGGGYALGTGNSVANYIPVEHYLAMVDEGRAWRG